MGLVSTLAFIASLHAQRRQHEPAHIDRSAHAGPTAPSFARGSPDAFQGEAAPSGRWQGNPAFRQTGGTSPAGRFERWVAGAVNRSPRASAAMSGLWPRDGTARFADRPTFGPGFQPTSSPATGLANPSAARTAAALPTVHGLWNPAPDAARHAGSGTSLREQWRELRRTVRGVEEAVAAEFGSVAHRYLDRQMLHAIETDNLVAFMCVRGDGAAINHQRRRDGETALTLLAQQAPAGRVNHFDILDQVLHLPDARGDYANPNIRNHRGDTALHIAAWTGNREFARRLMIACVPHPELAPRWIALDARDSRGRTAHDIAVMNGHHDIARLLSEYGEGRARWVAGESATTAQGEAARNVDATPWPADPVSVPPAANLAAGLQPPTRQSAQPALQPTPQPTPQQMRIASEQALPEHWRARSNF